MVDVINRGFDPSILSNAMAQGLDIAERRLARKDQQGKNFDEMRSKLMALTPEEQSREIDVIMNMPPRITKARFGMTPEEIANTFKPRESGTGDERTSDPTKLVVDQEPTPEARRRLAATEQAEQGTVIGQQTIDRNNLSYQAAKMQMDREVGADRERRSMAVLAAPTMFTSEMPGGGEISRQAASVFFDPNTSVEEKLAAVEGFRLTNEVEQQMRGVAQLMGLDAAGEADLFRLMGDSMIQDILFKMHSNEITLEDAKIALRIRGLQADALPGQLARERELGEIQIAHDRIAKSMGAAFLGVEGMELRNMYTEWLMQQQRGGGDGKNLRGLTPIQSDGIMKELFEKQSSLLTNFFTVRGIKGMQMRMDAVGQFTDDPEHLKAITLDPDDIPQGAVTFDPTALAYILDPGGMLDPSGNLARKWVEKTNNPDLLVESIEDYTSVEHVAQQLLAALNATGTLDGYALQSLDTIQVANPNFDRDNTLGAQEETLSFNLLQIAQQVVDWRKELQARGAQAIGLPEQLAVKAMLKMSEMAGADLEMDANMLVGPGSQSFEARWLQSARKGREAITEQMDLLNTPLEWQMGPAEPGDGDF